MKPWTIPTVALAAGIATGLSIGWGLWSPKPAPPAERWEPPIRQEDGSLILERRPQSSARPAQQLPKGATLERAVQVTIAPHPKPPATPGPAQPEEAGLPPVMPPDPVRVDLSLVRMEDRTRRVIASSPDGTVVGGVDIPIEPATVAKVPRWAAGAVFGTTAFGDKATGAFLDRDAGPFRIGAEVTRNTYADAGRQAWEVRAKVGIRF